MKTIVLQAQLSDSSGFGVAARQYYRILKSIAQERGLSFRIVVTKTDLIVLPEHQIWNESEVISEDEISKFVQENEYYYFFHANLTFAMKLSSVSILSQYAEKTYCLTVWESNAIYRQWVEFLHKIKCHDIVVPSSWNQTIFSSSFENINVHYIPHYAERYTTERQTNIPFSLLSISQDVSRKNWYKTILAFYAAFHEQEVLYTIKTNGDLQAPQSYQEEQKRRFIEMINNIKMLYPQAVCKVKLIYAVRNDDDIIDLFKNNTHFYTATHGEGFGLGILEAKNSGLSIIAPSKGGHIDFCNNRDYLFEAQEEFIFDRFGIFPRNATWYDCSVFDIAKTLKKAKHDFSNLHSNSQNTQEIEAFSYSNCKKSFDLIF